MPDLVLLDVNMPGIGGLEACREIRQSSDARHVHIEKYKVGLLLTNSFHRFLARFGLDDHVALAGESGTQHSPNLRLIVRD